MTGSKVQLKSDKRCWQRSGEAENLADARQSLESLTLISTHWPLITDPVKFVLRYAPAIRKYLQVLLSQSADVDEVVQEILLNVLERGFTPDRVRRGRFRDYLIATVRYSAWRSRRPQKALELSAEQADALQAPVNIARMETEWLTDWRQCLLDWAWATIESKQRRSRGNWHYTVLKLATDHPKADSKQLAAQV